MPALGGACSGGVPGPGDLLWGVQIGFIALKFPYVHAMDSLVRYLLTSWQPASRLGLFGPLACKCISLLNLMIWYVLVYLWKQ